MIAPRVVVVCAAKRTSAWVEEISAEEQARRDARRVRFTNQFSDDEKPTPKINIEINTPIAGSSKSTGLPQFKGTKQRERRRYFQKPESSDK